MLNTYKDRGIIKWAAFDALNGFNSMLKEMQYRLKKIKKPILSNDALEMLNRKLNEALHNHLEVAITYFKDGYSKVTYGKIKKVDYIYKFVILSTLEKISASDILNIDLL